MLGVKCRLRCKQSSKTIFRWASFRVTVRLILRMTRAAPRAGVCGPEETAGQGGSHRTSEGGHSIVQSHKERIAGLARRAVLTGWMTAQRIV